jgi:hypothetical protein
VCSFTVSQLQELLCSHEHVPGATAKSEIFTTPACDVYHALFLGGSATALAIQAAALFFFLVCVVVVCV